MLAVPHEDRRGPLEARPQDPPPRLEAEEAAAVADVEDGPGVLEPCLSDGSLVEEVGPMEG